MNRDLRTKRIIATTAFLVIAVMLYGGVLQISRIGKTKVAISVIPSKSTIYINGKKVSKTNLYVKPGQYKFTAKAEGYIDDSIDFTVEKKSGTGAVILLPKPDSAEAVDYFKNNPSIQAQKEALGGQKTTEAGQKLTEKYPIISQLPYIDILGPFSIDYGPSKIQPDGMVLFVSDSSPGGRQKALKWIRENNQEPTDLEIVFSDYLSPLTGKLQPAGMEGQIPQ